MQPLVLLERVVALGKGGIALEPVRCGLRRATLRHHREGLGEIAHEGVRRGHRRQPHHPIHVSTVTYLLPSNRAFTWSALGVEDRHWPGKRVLGEGMPWLKAVCGSVSRGLWLTVSGVAIRIVEADAARPDEVHVNGLGSICRRSRSKTAVLSLPTTRSS